ncbi:peptidoglycan editing factor PgeF [Metabacillus fastidiosus]|uniref:Purine nucleoside phosphorylase n=1 Tax=Metabacillus fastidiosus TaxID=1458 RepID=A0ABU6NYC0_9BACI|nr:peptidoglycan editing factor PgeF [Metabacillus fastidiosus]MED4401653.1 peptidoglycan editing factor PgeF [Metabacillus fastidiosus]MED4463292.1 peptidoglycan editing factor PgeF [Metabacillus fastidiosus]
MMEPFQIDRKDGIKFTIPEWKGILAGFTTKNGGVSKTEFASLNLGLHVHDEREAVVENRELLAESLSFPLYKWVFADQIHSNHIEKITDAHIGKGTEYYSDSIAKADGLYTSGKGIMLALCYADCVPLYFYAPTKGLIGAAHAGWKGSVSDIGGKMVQKWEEDEGVSPNEVKVVIGPSIGSCCYVVDDYVKNFVDQIVSEISSKPYDEISTGQYTLDLKQLNKLLLLRAGIKEENIFISQLCTSCEKDYFFSHRRDKGKTGRMLSYIGFQEEI